MSTDVINQVFTLVDDRAADGFAALFAPDGRFTFGNAEPLHGRPAIAEGVAAFFAGLRGLRHRVVNHWEVAADTMVELTVDYVRLDGKTIEDEKLSLPTKSLVGKVLQAGKRRYVRLVSPS